MKLKGARAVAITSGAWNACLTLAAGPMLAFSLNPGIML
jgi:hypothetical protein